MKRLFLVIACLAACLACSGTKMLPIHNQVLSDQIEKDKNATVMLVDEDEDGNTSAYCSGVWINSEQILTAYHCIRDAEKDFDQEVGDKVKVAYRDDYMLMDHADSVIKESHPAIVIKTSHEDDLALLKINNPYHKHGFALISSGEIIPGDQVVVVGHPIGFSYVWVPGTVVWSEYMERSNHHYSKTLFITSSAWFGNSGGAAFDMQGNVVGICSFLVRGPQMTFFVHRDEIVKFLDK